MKEIPTPLIQGKDYPLWLVRRFMDPDGHDEALVRDTLASDSLNFYEKNRVLTTSLSEFQVCELHRVFAGEREEFARLIMREGTTVFRLNAETVLTAFLLGLYHGVGFSREIETASIRRMVNRAGRRGARSILDRFPKDFWEDNKACSLVWCHAMPKDHLSWELCGNANGKAAVPALI